MEPDIWGMYGLQMCHVSGLVLCFLFVFYLNSIRANIAVTDRKQHFVLQPHKFLKVCSLGLTCFVSI